MVLRKANNATAGCTLDVVAIVKFFGGQTELVRDLKKYEIVEITTAAIDKWQLRNQLPGARLMDLQSLAELKGKKFNLSSYIIRPAKAAVKKKAA